MKKLLASLLLTFALFATSTPFALAEDTTDPDEIKDSSSFNVFDILSIDEDDVKGQSEQITQNLVDEAAAKNTSPVGALILRMINILSLLLGTFAVIMLMIGGVMFITAQGDESQTDRGKAILTQTVFGVFVAFSAYMLIRMIISLFF